VTVGNYDVIATPPDVVIPFCRLKGNIFGRTLRLVSLIFIALMLLEEANQHPVLQEGSEQANVESRLDDSILYSRNGRVKPKNLQDVNSCVYIIFQV